MDYNNCKEHYIKTSNKIRRKTITLSNKIFNSKENVDFIKENHLNELQTLDNIFYLLDDKINYINSLLKEKKINNTNTNTNLKKSDLNKLFPIFYYYMYCNQNNQSLTSVNDID